MLTQEEGRSGEEGDVIGDLLPRPSRRSVVRSLSTMHMMGFTPLGFFETVSEGDNLVEGHMSLPTGQPRVCAQRLCVGLYIWFQEIG